MKENEQSPNNRGTDSEAANSANNSGIKADSTQQSRREFLTQAATVGAAIVLAGVISDETEASELINDLAKAGSIQNPSPPDTIKVALEVNGKVQELKVDPRSSLLDALREYMGLTGTKKGCDHGQCGACTVLVDGRRINSCLTFAVMYQGRKITTIEERVEWIRFRYR